MPSERSGIPLEPYADRILDLGGRFPLFLQVACAGVFDHLTENNESEPDWARLTHAFMEEVGPYFRSRWARFDDVSRENLTRIANGKPAKRKYVNTKLLRRGYLREEDDGLRIFASSFEEFVLGEAEQSQVKRRFLGRIRGLGRFGKR